MKRFLRSQVDDKPLLCPYCGDSKSFDDRGCCGESSVHFEDGYEIDGEYYLDSEVILYDDAETMAQEQKDDDEYQARKAEEFKRWKESQSVSE